MRRQRISRAISLLAALLIPVCMTSGAFAEDYSSLSLDELTEMRNSINVEIRERKEAQEAENALQFTSADDFGYVDNGSEVMIRSYNGSKTDIVIPSEINGLPVTRIGENAFFENSLITSVVIPSSVMEIGKLAFFSCASLEKVVFSENTNEIESNSALTSSNLGKVKTIGDGAFAFDYKLSGVITLNADTLIIGEYAFEHDAIIGIKIYANAVQVNRDTFEQMDNLRFLFISDNAQFTGNKNFISHCPNLESFVVPVNATISYSNDDLFTNCPKLTIYTPADNDLTAYAKKQFIRCLSNEYQDMSALLDAYEE